MTSNLIKFDNTYSRLPERFFSKATPSSFTGPELLSLNTELANRLGLNLSDFTETELADFFSAQKVIPGSFPIALVYAAHQFGHFVPQLGDGRAMLLGEVLDPQGKRFDIQLKGSGPTMYSRNGDGKSALGPVIREYIVSEAMYHLGVPTTRALAAVATGDLVYRETPIPGAVLTRVAASHIRIGTFQYFAARGDIEGLKILLNYTIDRHYPEIKNESESLAVLFLRKVIAAQISLVSKWMSFGFIHGVMNTDNMLVSGETIDYGPCAFMDKFNYNQVYSFIDKNGRYAYSNQGMILEWNMARLAECLIPLIDGDKNIAMELLNKELSTLTDQFNLATALNMGEKLGIASVQKNLVKMWLDYLNNENLDFTLSFRNLSELLRGKKNLYKPTEEFKKFEAEWWGLLEHQGTALHIVKKSMDSINPIYIPRNHQVERAIQLAIQGDQSVFHEMNELLRNPFSYQEKYDSYRNPPLLEEEIKNTFCGT